MARRILNRKDLRADFDAAERRKDEDPEEKEDEEEAEDGEEKDEADAEAEGEGDDEDEEAPKKKKPAKAKAKAKAPKTTKPRSRAAKVARMRVVWGVFNNSNQCVATYEYPRKTEAEEHVKKLIADKRSTHFLQPVKEPIEEKKEK